MIIKLSNAGKRFNRDWIFKKFTYQFTPGETYAITGPNGSGKSTLLQVLSGNMAVSDGKAEWEINNKKIDEEKVHQFISIAAPYLEVIEEMTGLEFLHFHEQFKRFDSSTSASKILAIVGLENAMHKQIRYYSSGMKQRVKLAQAIFSDTPVLLLDEPCTNLDTTGIELYHELIKNYTAKKTVVVCSNDVVEYSFCKNIISITDYK